MNAVAERLSAALLSRYRIERELGQGGMATVYLAFDVKHDRKVALKVLKPELAAVIGAERFVVEIKTTASLLHPHILPLFDSGSADGFLYYVMPFIDGETLRDKLNRETQLGVDEAVRIAVDVGDALHYAHSAGVIHRDIKPENILLANGRPMVADFGIALALSAAAGGRMTETGMSLGTPHYMSPEQATAEKDISARSDVYSLASVLYEMLAGQPPHLGGSAQQIIMKIITEQPQDVRTLRKSVPLNVAAALSRALEKLPADRFSSAKEFGDALQSPAYSRAGVVHAGAATTRDWRSVVALPAIALASLLLMVVIWGATRTAAPMDVSRYEVVRPAGTLGEISNVVVSPDGSRIVIGARSSDGVAHLYVRRRDELDAAEIAGTEGGINPSFSPDGQKIVYMSGTLLRVVDLAGAPPVTIADSAVGVPGVSWGPDGYIYLDARGVAPLARVKETGGKLESVSTLDTASGELQHVWPDVLPNGRGVIMTLSRGGPGQGGTETDAIGVLDLRTGKHRELFRGIFARYAPSGHILVVTRDGNLFVAPFDQAKLDVTGPLVPMAKGLAVSSNGSGSVALSISRTGTLWYTLGGTAGARREAGWMTPAGAFTPLDPALTGNIVDAKLSPDGEQLAFIMNVQDGAHVWVTGLKTRSRTRLTFDRSYDKVAWHPDGKNLIVTRAPGEFLRVRSDGSSVPEPLLKSRINLRDASWSPDGSHLVFAAQSTSAFDIYATSPGSESMDTIVSTADGERIPSISPDGRWLLYQAGRGSSTEIFVRPYPKASVSVHQVSIAGGSLPVWSRDGHQIFYQNGHDSLASVTVLAGPSFAVGEEHAYISLRGIPEWDVAPDGQHFLVVRYRESALPERLVVVENFLEELNKKVKQ